MTIISEETELSFKPIPIKSLRIDTSTNFDIYIKPQENKAPVLYRESSLVFTHDALMRLENNNIDTIYINESQEDVFQRYTEDNLENVLNDESIPIEEKSTYLYDSAQGLIENIMSDPRAGDTVPRSKNIVENTCKLLFTNKDAFQGLLQVVSYDYYTYTHSVNVFVFSVSLAQRVLKDTSVLHDFGVGALLHDIGKSEIAPDIINCKGALSDTQWEEIRKHPAYGSDILFEHGTVGDIGLDVVRHHHEKPSSGKGYPDGLKGKEVSQYARIVTIADIFDALTTKRSYKASMDTFPALKLMKGEISGELDSEYFGSFVRMMGKMKN